MAGDEVRESTPPKAPRQGGRPFEKGNKIGAAGRPPGSKHVALKMLDALGEESAGAILRTVVDAATGGDLRAAEIVLSRLWPVRKGRPVTIDLPTMTTAADLAAGLGRVAEAVGAGDLSAEEGQAVAAVLEAQRRAIETTQLEARIAALEGRTP